jgi:hypothetical protein
MIKFLTVVILLITTLSVFSQEEKLPELNELVVNYEPIKKDTNKVNLHMDMLWYTDYTRNPISNNDLSFKILVYKQGLMLPIVGRIRKRR